MPVQFHLSLIKKRSSFVEYLSYPYFNCSSNQYVDGIFIKVKFRMQQFVWRRSFSVLSNLTHAFWNTMTYGNAGSIPMKSLWKNKTELHDMGRMQTFMSRLPQKTYVKDWSIPAKKSKTQTNQWCKCSNPAEEPPFARYARRKGRRESQWNRL